MTDSARFSSCIGVARLSKQFIHPSRGSGVIVLKRNFNTAEFACLYSPPDSKL